MRSVRWAMVGFLLLLSLHCGNHLLTTSPGPFRNSEFLPKPDLAVTIPGLGPCTDDPDRTLRLDSHQPVTILVHGCNGSAGRFQALAEVFSFHGQQTVGFSYNDRDDLLTSSRQLAKAIHALAAKLHSQQITLIGHSQGGLLARRALVSEPSEIQWDPGLQISLVTISSPFSGIKAADHCGSPLARAVSLGLVVPICRLVTGAKWRDIVYNGAFITRPGVLIPQVTRHLKINSDERDSCRLVGPDGSCLKSDFTFSLEEQRHPLVDAEPCVQVVDAKAGHVEIVGDQQVIPTKLLALLQENGILKTTTPQRRGEWSALLARLYLDEKREDQGSKPLDHGAP